MALFITFAVMAIVGYAVGWLCGLVIGSLVWYKRAQRMFQDDLSLEILDFNTDWEVLDIEEDF